jgi:hypothetical protein
MLYSLDSESVIKQTKKGFLIKETDIVACRAVTMRRLSRQWLSKHVPVARQQIFNNAEEGLQQWKSSPFCVARAEML